MSIGSTPQNDTLAPSDDPIEDVANEIYQRIQQVNESIDDSNRYFANAIKKRLKRFRRLKLLAADSEGDGGNPQLPPAVSPPFSLDPSLPGDDGTRRVGQPGGDPPWYPHPDTPSTEPVGIGLPLPPGGYRSGAGPGSILPPGKDQFDCPPVRPVAPQCPQGYHPIWIEQLCKWRCEIDTPGEDTPPGGGGGECEGGGDIISDGCVWKRCIPANITSNDWLITAQFCLDSRSSACSVLRGFAVPPDPMEQNCDRGYPPGDMNHTYTYCLGPFGTQAEADGKATECCAGAGAGECVPAEPPAEGTPVEKCCTQVAACCEALAKMADCICRVAECWLKQNECEEEEGEPDEGDDYEIAEVNYDGLKCPVDNNTPGVC